MATSGWLVSVVLVAAVVQAQYRNRPYDEWHRGEPQLSDTSWNDDKRCPQAIQSLRTAARTVSVRLPQGGSVTGRYVYLCDGPGVPEQIRPNGGHYNRPLTYLYNNISVFLGIPYAKPPVRELRFKDPQFPSAWNHVNASTYKPACPQHVAYYGIDRGVPRVEEDCLYLNVFTPYAGPLYRERYAVMVYIHGGFWEHGSGNVFPAHILVASQQVVVVTFNYRLGALGFLATADNSSAGNYGMLDQQMAIQWVYDNIDSFNGDRDRITLFGPGAGAASAGLHAISPYTGRLVKRVIAQSGSAVAEWATIIDPTFMNSSSYYFAEMLGCSSKYTERLVECLRQKHLNDIIKQSLKPKVGWTMWAPVVDGHTRNKEHQIIPEPPDILLLRSDTVFHHNFAYMTGISKDDTRMFIKDELKRRKIEINKETLNRRIFDFINMYNYTLDRLSLINAINFMYLPWADPHNLTLIHQAFGDLFTDSHITAPMDKMIKLLLKKNVRTFMYVLNSTLEGLEPYHDVDGVQYDTEHLLITGAPFMDTNIYPPYLNLVKAKWTEADRNISQLMMEMWANFAKEAHPTNFQLFDHVKWGEVSLNNLQYLSINTTNYTTYMRADYRQKECQFWNDYIPMLINRILPTWPPLRMPWQKEKDTYQYALIGVASAAGLFFLIMVCCCCLYCRIKGKHLVEDEDIPDHVSNSTPTNAFLDMKKLEPRGSDDNLLSTARPNKHTMV